MKNSILLLSCIFESTVSIHMHIWFQKIMKCITHLCMHTSQPQNLCFWPKRPPLAFSVAETSVAEIHHLYNWNYGYNSKTCLKRPLKIDKTKILMRKGSLMQIKSIAECSPLEQNAPPQSILQYFWPALSDNWSWKLIFGLLFEWPLKTGFTVIVFRYKTNTQVWPILLHYDLEN